MKDETGKVIFDQEEQAVVDRIVQERLARAKTPEDYEHLKDIEKELEDFGWQGTAAEKKEAIKAYKQELKAQQELEALEQQAKTTGKDPELLQAIKTLEKKIETLEGERNAHKQTEAQKKQAEEAWNKQVTEFQEAFTDVNLEALEKNAKFIDFIQGSGWSLKTAYEKYLKIINEAEKEAFVKAISKESRSTPSGKGGGDHDGGSYGLNADEKAFVDEHNRKYPKMKMTYKEYSERKRS